MFPYFLLIGIPIVYSLIVNLINIEKRKRQKGIIISFFVSWIILLSLRDKSVGADITNYLIHFQKVTKTSWGNLFEINEMEYGYQILCKLISYLTSNSQVFLFIIAILSLLPICYLFCREAKNALLAITLFITYLFTMYFSGLRQVLAMSCFVPAYYFTKEKKFFKFLLMVFLATTFHSSSFIICLFYPIYHFKLTKIRALFVTLIVLIIFVFNEQIFSFLVRSMGGRYEERYGIITTTGAYRMQLLIFIFLIYAFIVPQKNKLDKDTVGLRNVLILSFVLQSFAAINPVAMRMNYYFLIFLPILIAKIPTLCREKDKKIADFSIFVMITFFIFYFFYVAYTGIDMLQIFPYIPFWEG